VLDVTGLLSLLPRSRRRGHLSRRESRWYRAAWKGEGMEGNLILLLATNDSGGGLDKERKAVSRGRQVRGGDIRPGSQRTALFYAHL